MISHLLLAFFLGNLIGVLSGAKAKEFDLSK